jgi:hypothetical protein
MREKEQVQQNPIAVYELLPLMAKLSILSMESKLPKFCRHLFLYALERISEYEINENGKLEESSQAIGPQLIEAIHSVTDATCQFVDKRDEYLNLWIGAVFKVILPDYKSDLQRIFRPLKNDLSEEQLKIILGLGLLNPRARKPTRKEEEEIENLKPLCQSSGAAARMVIDAMARMQKDIKTSQRTLVLWSAMNFPAAALAISIYFEALAFTVETQKKRKPSDMKWPLLVVYLWRKLGIKKKLPAVEARLRYGKNFNDSGSLYKRALDLFRESNPADQEIAADAYCDAFMSNLNQLPTEALLNPKLAIGYLSKSSKRAATRKLPRQKIELVDPNDSRSVSIFEPSQFKAFNEHSDSALEEKVIPDEIKSLRDYELFMQWAINKRSLAELGKDQAITGRDRSISKQAVHKRKGRVKKKILESQEKDSSIPVRVSKRLSDEEWKRIKPLLPALEPKSKRGGRRKDDRRMMGLLLYKMRTGCPWNDLPKGRTLLARYNEWHAGSVFKHMKHSGILQELGITSMPPRRKSSQ